MVIIGVALLEEIKMQRELGDEYKIYAARTPFMFPLPVIISGIVALPMRLVIWKKRPERGAEVAVVVLAYLGLLVLASWFIRTQGLLTEWIDFSHY